MDKHNNHLSSSPPHYDMLAWSRLPTPAPHIVDDKDHLLDVEHVSDTDADVHSSSRTSSPRSLSIYAYPLSSASSATSSSSSSSSDAHPDSPTHLSQNFHHHGHQQGLISAQHATSKTAAFFGSPFAPTNEPTPAPPPKLVPPILQHPDLMKTPRPDINMSATTSTRSATADFFASPSISERPTPPPSLRSQESPRVSLPPLARFFPSRYTRTETAALANEESERYVAKGKGPSLSSPEDNTAAITSSASSASTPADWETSFKREFLQIAEAQSQANSPDYGHAYGEYGSHDLARSPVDEKPLPPPPPSASSTSTVGQHHNSIAVTSNVPPSTAITGLHHYHDRRQQQHPIRRETHMTMTQQQDNADEGAHGKSCAPPAPGVTISSGAGPDTVQLQLVNNAGEGAFSSVWLARDVRGNLPAGNGIEHSTPKGGNTLSSDVSHPAGSTLVRSPARRRKSESWAKRGSDKRMHGIRPTPASIVALATSVAASFGTHGHEYGHDHPDSDEDRRSVRSVASVSCRSADGSVVLDELDGEGASIAAHVTNDTQGDVEKEKRSKFRDEDEGHEDDGRLVAVKMLNRALCDVNDRTRISFVREVEVLRHISHPSIVSYLHSFTTASHHCLVLEYVPGGELFTLVNSDEQYKRVTESALRRMWGELIKAVGWMHGVALVHRDIKLENILLTSNVFAGPGPATLPPLGTPLVKLTDFGLARFIDPSNPLLSTRCGSEQYAAPELVLGPKRMNSTSSTTSTSSHLHSSYSSPTVDASDDRAALPSPITTPAAQSSVFLPQIQQRGYYDGRQTDAWACGVVLYALATRQLPFDVPPPGATGSRPGSRPGSLRRAGRGVDRQYQQNVYQYQHGGSGRQRREMLMRIAQCEYGWPDEGNDDGDDDVFDGFEVTGEDVGERPGETARRLAGGSPALKNVVRRLLVRAPAERARLVELWDEDWLKGVGAPAPPVGALKEHGSSTSTLTLATNGYATTAVGFGVDANTDNIQLIGRIEKRGDTHSASNYTDDADGSIEDGVLVDREHIDRVALQDVDDESSWP